MLFGKKKKDEGVSNLPVIDSMHECILKIERGFHGRFLVDSSYYLGSDIFKIYLCPEIFTAELSKTHYNQCYNSCIYVGDHYEYIFNKGEAVLVYDNGIWLHEGKIKDDIYKIVNSIKEKEDVERIRAEKDKLEKDMSIKEYQDKLVADYK